MKKHIKVFNSLIYGAADYLLHQLFYAEKSVELFKRNCRRLREVMVTNEIEYFDSDAVEKILLHEFQDRSHKELSSKEKTHFNHIMMLSEFSESGQISLPARSVKAPITFSGPLGDLVNDFLEYKRTELRLSTIRLNCYKRHLSTFVIYCNRNEILVIDDVDLIVLLKFIGQLDCNGTLVGIAISTLRGFTKYLYEQKQLSVDYSIKIPRYRKINQPKIPSTYTADDIARLISSVERSSAMGKRNYALILLAARLGLRASDISRLKFENFCWSKSTIEIKQYKTGRELVLPILPDVGNAIIDYLKYGRPNSKESFVFLTQRPPYGRFTTSNVVTHVVQRAFRKAGIDITGKHFGAHSLRHSLGFRMLEQSTVLPVISEVLGHESTESTKYYLRIDITSMKQCMLDVTPVPVAFYEQKGGAFYD